MTSWRVALGYIAFSVLALALFATPLWYGWRANIGTFRTYVPEEMQALVDLFQREGAAAVTAAVRSQSGNVPRDEVVLFAGPGKEVLAGTLRAWPAEVPDAPGTYGLVIGLGANSSMRVVASHVSLPGGYHLLMGRESVRFESLVERFWLGMAAALTIVLALGAGLAWLLARRTSAVRHSEERYARAMQASKDGIWEWNPATDEIFISDRARQLWAVPDGVAVRTRAELKRLGGFHPDDFQRTEDVVAAHLGAHEFDMEYRVIGPAGDKRWLRSQGKAFPGKDGRPELVTGSLTDITEGKRAEEALRESQTRYERVMLASNPGIWDWDVVKDEFYVSPRFLEMGGLPPDTVFSGREDFMRRGPLHPEDREKWKQAVRQLFASGGSRLSMELRALVNGETRWRRLEGICFRDAAGGVVRWTGSTTDITERKHAEEALHRSEERFALALAASSDGIWDWDLVTEQQFFSERAQRICGLEPGPTVRPHSEWNALREFHPVDAPRRLAAVERHLAGETPVYEGEWRVRAAGNAGGEYRWIQTRGLCVRDAAGRAIRMVGSLTDIDERKRIEAALRQSEERYSLAMEATEEGHYDVNVDTGELFTSERMNEIYGFAPGTQFERRRDYLKQFRFYGNDADTYHAAICAAEAKGGPERYEFEYRILRPSGEMRWLRTRGKVTRDAEGRARRRTGVVADITEAKLAQEALLQSQERYALAMEAAADGHTDWNLVTGEFYISPRLLGILGYAQDATFADRADWVRRFPFHPEDRTRWEAAIAAHFAGREAKFRMDLRIVVRGETRWVAFTFIASRDPAGKPVRWSGTITDINDAKLAEEALRESQERYALAVAGSNDGIWDWDLLTSKMFVSERAQRIFGLEPGPTERLREEWHAMIGFHPDDHRAQRRMVEEYLSGARSSNEGEWRVQDKDSGYRWIRIRSICLRSSAGEAVRMAGSVSDIDAQKKAEEALRASEERYALAVAGSDAGVWDYDFVARRHFSSARARELGGLPPEPQALPMEQGFAALPLHPEDVPRRIEAMQAHMAGKTPMYQGEFRVRQPDGSYRWRHIQGLCVRDANGKPLRLAGSISDIDARKRAEEALRLSEARYALAMEVAEEGHFDWNVQTDEIFASAQALRVIGLPPDGEYRTGAEVMAHVRYHPDDWPRISNEWQAALAGKAVDHEFEYRILRGEEPRTIRGRWKVFRDESGAALRVIGIVADITPRKLAEEALRRSEAALRLSEERYALALEASEEGHFDNDLLTGEIFVSARVNEIYGFPRQARTLNRIEFLNQIPVHPDDRHVLAELSRPDWQDPAGDLYEIECRIVPRPGETRWIHSRAKVVRDAEGRARRRVGVVTDITERKLAEEALRQSEERYALAVAGSNEGIFDWDLVSDRVYVSHRAQELFGLPCGELWRPRRDWRHILSFHPDDAPRLHDSIKAHIEGGTPTYDEEFRIALPGGGVRWFRQRGIALRDPSGKAYRVVGSIGDITERKQALETLRESESRFRTLVELNSGGFWEQDENLRYTPSAFAHDITGYSTDDRVGKTRWELCGDLTPLSGSWLEHQADLAARRPFRDFEYRRLRPDGEIGYYSASGAPIFDDQGRFKGYYGVATDITERKRFEEQLRSRQEMLELAQKSARAIAFEWKIGTGEGENRWSPDLEAMYGFKPGTYDGSFETWKKLVHPEDWPAVKEAIEHAHRTGEVASEYRVVHLDGSVHWLQAKGRMFFDTAGNARRMVGFMQDVTQRKHAEDELRKMEQELRRAQRLEAMGTLAGGISHDFNNILGAILGYGEMAMRDAKKGSRLRRDLDSIMAAGERGRALVDRILAFSRSGVAERVPVHVEAVVREALDQVAAKLPENVTIAPRLHAGRAAMLGDSTQVHQVVMNLANNAVQAMPQGGFLRVSLDTLRIEAPRAALIGTVSPGEHIVLKVTDGGTGIRPEVLERMFDPFFTTKEVGVGSGLGLSLVHGIVATVGGAIDVATELGKGSTFTVYLPRSGDAPAKAADENRPLPRGEGERVLVVDDEEPLVRLATETLESLGYAPVGFTSSVNALQEFGANPEGFDAILTDERMPGVTGSAIIREVRRISPSIPILLMSGFVGGAAALKARELGANDVLKKPLLARELATSLARVLRP